MTYPAPLRSKLRYRRQICHHLTDNIYTQNYMETILIVTVPVQLMPSVIQLKDPSVLLQIAWRLQLSVLMAHSSISKKDKVTGPLLDPVTWYRVNYARTQVTQWDFHNKEKLKLSWTSASSFDLEIPLCNLRPCVTDTM